MLKDQKVFAVQLKIRYEMKKHRELTTLAEEKKSISLPIVNGIDIETVEDTNSSPTAVKSGFLSGFANATIFRKDETDAAGPVPDDKRRGINPVFAGFMGFFGSGSVLYVRY